VIEEDAMTSRTLVSLCLVAALSAACSEDRVFTPPAVDLPMSNLQVTPEPREGMSKGADAWFAISFTATANGRMTLSALDQTGARLRFSERAFDLVADRPTAVEIRFPVPATATSVRVIARLFIDGEAEPLEVHFPYATR
jgi:hypothetical protein